jgi:hypothetical protein
LSNAELKQKIFKYLFFYSVSDVGFALTTFFCWVCRSGHIFAYSGTYAAKLYELFVYTTGLNFFGSLSTFIEIAITFDRLFLMKNITNKLTNLSPRTVCLFLGLLAAATASIYVFSRSIKLDENFKLNVIRHEYKIDFNELGNSQAFQIIYPIVSFFKNFVSLFFLIAINILLVIEIKKFYEKKKKLLNYEIKFTSENVLITTNNNKNVTLLVKNSSGMKDRRPSVQKYTKMTMSIFFCYLIGNLAGFIINIFLMYFKTLNFTPNLVAVLNVPQFFTKGLNLFIYYFFNKKYKKIFNSIFKLKSNN